ATRHRHSRSGEPLGLMLHNWNVVVLVAPYPRTAVDPRLCRCTRGGASRRNEPRPSVLGAGAQDDATDGRGQGVATRLRHGLAPVRPGGLKRGDLPGQDSVNGAMKIAASMAMTTRVAMTNPIKTI